MLFEFIEIKNLKLKFEIMDFLSKFHKPHMYHNYEISLKIKNKSQSEDYLLEFHLEEKDERKKYKFLTFYSNLFNILVMNIDIYNKQKIILLEFLNKVFSNSYYFKSYTLNRGKIWEFLRQVNIIELEIIFKNDIIDYLEFEEDITISEDVKKRIENFPIFSSLISFNINDNNIVIKLYNNKFELPGNFNLNKLDLVITKMSPIFI